MRQKPCTFLPDTTPSLLCDSNRCLGAGLPQKQTRYKCKQLTWGWHREAFVGVGKWGRSSEKGVWVTGVHPSGELQQLGSLRDSCSWGCCTGPASGAEKTLPESQRAGTLESLGWPAGDQWMLKAHGWGTNNICSNHHPDFCERPWWYGLNCVPSTTPPSICWSPNQKCYCIWR